MTKFNNTLYLSGQVPNLETIGTTDITKQTEETLAKIDDLLKLGGSDKRHVLSSQIWLRHIDRDFAKMNLVWNNWVGGEEANKGVRACVESKMAREGILVEIKVIAAVP